jgi:formate hydrogenlyase subunit 6/NADH:ubiquinone oxidoreductase subunit I
METLREMNRRRDSYAGAFNDWNFHLGRCPRCQTCVEEHPDDAPACTDGERLWTALREADQLLTAAEERSPSRR